MYRAIEDFQQNWAAESAATLKLLRALTDASLQQPVEPNGRTLGRIAWHIVLSIGEMLGRTGLAIESLNPETPVPATAAEIADAYARIAAHAAVLIRDTWTDANLLDEMDMYGERWTNGFTLAALCGHEIHHRGQLTVLMRQAGLSVPGIYGPSREEWSAYGIPAMP